MNSTKIFHTTADFGETWQKELADGIDDLASLYQILQLSPDKNWHEPKKFPLKVPKAFVAKMKTGDQNDPLLLQILPTLDESVPTVGYTHDPLAENDHNPLKGLLHKYQSRVLLTLTGACAVHCRYCFRQHFDYSANMPTSSAQAAIIDYIASHTEIDEVLLSGGDPLSLSNRRLQGWLDELAKIPHIRTIRLHTRLPVVLPNRVDGELLTMLGNSPKNIVMVLHINHPNEIDDTLAQKCKLLKQANVTLLNQTVLLKNINDNVTTLTRLSHDLFGIGVLPYYLHILDKVQGAAHFDLPIEQAVALYWQLLEKLSGYLVPKLVQELPNKPYKTPVDIHRYKST